MNPWNTYTDWDEFARTCLANIVHMTLGLAGEAGELVEAAGSPFGDADVMALEVADVVTYACDIAAALGCTIRPDLAPLAGLPSTDAIVAAAGKIANIVSLAAALDKKIAICEERWG